MTCPIKLDTNPRTESITLNSLVQTDNKLFNKVIMIFAYLCDQVATLKQQAQAHFFEPLLLAAEGEDLSVEGEPSVRAHHQLVAALALNAAAALADSHPPARPPAHPRLARRRRRDPSRRRRRRCRCSSRCSSSSRAPTRS